MPQRDLVQSNVRAKLSGLRASLRRRLAVEGLAWILLAMVAIVFATLALDYTLHLDRIPRIIVMALALGWVGYVAWRRLVRPASVTMDDEGLALLVESKWRQLGDRLISAIQFADTTNPAPGVSQTMIRQMAVEANQSASALPFGEIVEKRIMLRVLGLALAGMMLVAGFTVLTAPFKTMSFWFQRNVLFMNIDWPQKTYLTVVNDTHDFEVLRGDDLTVTVVADDGSEAPANVVFHTDYRNSVGKTEESVDVNSDKRSYTKVFAGVNEPFSFYVTGGDDKRDKARPHEVTLVDPPALNDVQYQVEYPAYTHKEPSPFMPVQGVIVAPIGSTLRLTATANKDLSEASLMLDKEAAGSAQVSPRNAKEFSAQVTIGGENKVASRMLRVMLKDTHPKKNSNRGGQQFVIQVQPDMLPSAEIKTQGIGANITAIARVPLLLKLGDDYGLSAGRIGATIQTKIAPVATSGPEAATTRPAVAMPVHDLDEKPMGRKNMTIVQTYDLNPPEKETPTSQAASAAATSVNPSSFLKPGDTLTVFVEIDDALPAYLGGPNRKTVSVDLKIVTPEEVREDLIRRQKEIAGEFAQAIVVQTAALAKTSGALADLNNNVTPTDVNSALIESNRSQTGVGQECAKAASQLVVILDEMRNNRVFEQSQYDVLQNDIINELQNLAPMIETVTTSMGKLTSAIDAKRADAAGVKSTVEQTTAAQQKILDRMETIKDAMVKESDRQDLINQVTVQKKVWADIRGNITGMIKSIGVGIFDKPSTSQPAGTRGK